MPTDKKNKTTSTPSGLRADIDRSLKILKEKSPGSTQFLKNTKKILDSFDKDQPTIDSFLNENSKEINLEKKTKLLDLFKNHSSEKTEQELIKKVIDWVLRNTSENNKLEDDSISEWRFADNILMNNNILYVEIEGSKGLKNCHGQLKKIQNNFERQKIQEKKDVFKLVLASLCLFILDKKNKFIGLAQEKEKLDQTKSAKANKLILLAPKSTFKNTPNSSSPHSQKEETKGLSPETGNTLLPISSQETIKNEADNKITHQKDTSLTKSLPNLEQPSLPLIQPSDLEASIEDNPTKLDQYKKEKTKVVEFTLYFPDQKNKTAESSLNGPKNLDFQDIARYQFGIETSLPYQDLKKISEELQNEKNSLKEKLLTLEQSPPNNALLNSKKSPLPLPINACLAIHTSTENNQTNFDQNKEEETKVVEVIIYFKNKIDSPDLVECRKSHYKKIAEKLSSTAIQESTSYKDLKKEIEGLKKEIKDLTSKIQDCSHQDAQKETNIEIYEEALNNAILYFQSKQEKFSENISSETSLNALIKDDIEETPQQANKNLIQKSQIKEIKQIKDKTIQLKDKNNLLAEKSSQIESIINNDLETHRENENQLDQLEKTALILEKKAIIEKDDSAHSAQLAKIESEIHQKDRVSTEKLDMPSSEKEKLIMEDQINPHQSTQKEIVIKSPEVRLTQPETQKVDLQAELINFADEDSQNLKQDQDNDISLILEEKNNDSESEGISISYIRDIDEKIYRLDQREEKLETKRSELIKSLENLISTSENENKEPESSSTKKTIGEIDYINKQQLENKFDKITKDLEKSYLTFRIKNEELDTSSIEKIAEQIISISQYQKELENKRAELMNNKKDYLDFVNEIKVEKYYSFTANMIFDEDDDIYANSLDNPSQGMQDLLYKEDKNILDWDDTYDLDADDAEKLEWDDNHYDLDANHDVKFDSENPEHISQQIDNSTDQDQEKYKTSFELESTFLKENTSKEIFDRINQSEEDKTTFPIISESLADQTTLHLENNQQLTDQEEIISEPTHTSLEDQEYKSQQIEELKTKLDEKNNVHQQDLQAKDDEIEKLNQENRQQEIQVTELKNLLKHNKDALDKKINELTDLSKEYKKNKYLLEQSKEKLSDQENSLNQNKKKLEDQINQLNQEKISLQQDLQAKYDEVDQLKVNYQQKQTTITELENQLTKIQGESNQQINELTNKLQEAEVNQKNTSQQINDLKSQLEENKTLLEKSKEDFSDQERLLTENNQQLKEKFENASQKIALQNKKISTLEKKNNTLQQALQDNSEKIAQLNAEHQQQEIQATELKDQLRQHQEKSHQEIIKPTNIVEEAYEISIKEANQEITKQNQEIASQRKTINDLIKKSISEDKTTDKSVQTEPLTNEEIGLTIGYLKDQSPIKSLSIEDNKEIQNKSGGIGKMGLGSSKLSDSSTSSSPKDERLKNSHTHRSQTLDTDSEDSSDDEFFDAVGTSELGSSDKADIDDSPTQINENAAGSSAASRHRSSSVVSDSSESDDSGVAITGTDESNRSEEETPTAEKTPDVVLEEKRSKDKPLFDFTSPESFSSFANIISSEIDKNNCVDITQLDEFKPSEAFQKLLTSNGNLKSALAQEKIRIEDELKEALSNLWKDYAKSPREDELKEKLATFKLKIEEIQDKSFEELLKEGIRTEEYKSLSEEYSRYIKSATDRTLKAGNYQTSSLLNQLKVKLSRCGFTSAKQAEQAFEKGMFIEKGTKKEEKKEINLKVGTPDDSDDIKPTFWLSEDDIEKMILTKFEKRLPLDFHVKTPSLNQFLADMFDIMRHPEAGFISRVFGLLASAIIYWKNKGSDEKRITDAFISVIEKNKLAVDPNEIRLEVKEKKSAANNDKKQVDNDKKNDDYTVLRKLDHLQQEDQKQIQEANEGKIRPTWASKLKSKWNSLRTRKDSEEQEKQEQSNPLLSCSIRS